MIIEVIDLKFSNYKVQRFKDGRLITLPSISNYQVNSSLIVLFTSKEKVVFFSFLLAKIFRMSLQEYDKYIIHFASNNFIPKILIDLNIIVPKNNSYRLSLSIHYFRNLAFNLSTDCNLRCRYCYANSGRRKEKKIISFRLAKAAIDFVTKYCGNELNLEFVGGGEPTTQFTLLKKIVYYAKKKIPQVKINPISTNGVFSKEIADWLIQNAKDIQVSCDGPDFIQNKYRPLANGNGSSQFVEKTIRYFVKKKKDFRVRATMTDDYFGNELKIINYFWNLGVKDVSFAPLDIVGAAEIMILEPKFKQNKFKKNKSLNDLLSIYQEYQKLIELQNEIGMNIGSLNFRLLGNTMTCGIYTKSNFVVDPDGYVSTCTKYTDINDIKKYPFMKDLIIGHYDFKTKKFKIDFKKVDDLKKKMDHQLEINKCRQCPLFTACHTVCLYELGRKTGTLDPSFPVCDKGKQIGKKSKTLSQHYLINLIFNYFSQRYFINKKPCLEFKNNKLFYSLLYTDFELSFSKNGSHLAKNPYILIDDLTNLKELAQKIINYKKNHEELIAFLLNFQIKREFRNKTYAKKIISFLKHLKNNRVYFKITEPLPQQMFSNTYEALCEEFNLPKTYKESLELYRVSNNMVYFSKDKIGSKKFSEYEDRDEIYQDYKKLLT